MSSLFVFIPKISLPSPQVIINPFDPFENLFILKNEGNFPIHDISTNLEIILAIDSKNAQIHNVSLVGLPNNFKKLRPEKETSLNISLEKFFGNIELPFKKAEIRVTVNYRYFIWKLTQSFHFEMRKDIAGKSIWYPLSE